MSLGSQESRIAGRLGHLSECVTGDDLVSWPKIGPSTTIEHQKKIAVLDRRQTMGDDNDRHVAAQFGQGAADQVL